MALPASVLGTSSPPCAPHVVRMTTPVQGAMSAMSAQPAAGARVVQPPQCRASGSRAMSPTFRSNLPFGDTSMPRSATPLSGAASPGAALGQGLASEPAAACLQRFFHSSSRARVHPPKTTSLVPQELPPGQSDILEDRGRRHFSPPPGASRGMLSPLPSAGHALPAGCSGPTAERGHRAAGCPSPPRFSSRHGSMSPRGASNSPGRADGSPRAEARHHASNGVGSCMRGDPPDRQNRAASPHLQSSSVRSLLQEEDSRGHLGDESRDMSTARTRWSPRRSPSRRMPRPRDPTAAGMAQSRTAMVGMAAAEGSPISASSAKEIQLEADSMQLRDNSAPSGLSPRSPRALQDACATPMIGDLSCHELRNMGKAVAEANLRMREQFHQAPPPATGRPRSPVRSSLKKTKGTTSSAGPPMSARNGGGHTGHERNTGRKGAASSNTSGAATPTPATPRPAPSTPQAALIAMRAEIQRSSSCPFSLPPSVQATLAPAVSMGSLHEVPHGVSLATVSSMGSLHEAPHGAASVSISSCSTEAPTAATCIPAMPGGASAYRGASGSATEAHKASLEEGLQRTESRITELRAEIEQLRFRRGGSPDPAMRERSGNGVERERSAKEERAPHQVNRMVTPHGSRCSAPPCLPRTPHRQVSSDEAVVLVTSARPPTPHRQCYSSDDVAVVTTAGRPEVDQRRGPVAEASNRVRFDDMDDFDDAEPVESEQTCRRRWESPKPGPGTPLPPGMNQNVRVYSMPVSLHDTPAAPNSLNVPVPAIAATAGSALAVKRSSSGSDDHEEAALEAELENVKRRHAEALQAELDRVRQQHQRRHAEALEAELERERHHHQVRKTSKLSPRTSFGGA